MASKTLHIPKRLFPPRRRRSSEIPCRPRRVGSPGRLFLVTCLVSQRRPAPLCQAGRKSGQKLGGIGSDLIVMQRDEDVLEPMEGVLWVSLCFGEPEAYWFDG